ncbi:hypothetical protein EMCRGX_G019279 [Ephydatia muelleri]
MSLQLPERMHNHYHRLMTPLDVLGSAQWFSTLDQASGYWQVKFNPEDREKAVFVTPYGLLQLHVMPFGLTNAPTKFQRLMEQILYEILIFIATVEEHLERLCDVLDHLKNAETKTFFHETTRVTPFSMMLRRVAWLPEDLMFGLPVDDAPVPQRGQEYVEHLKKTMQNDKTV